jgi:hypothetical protein
LILSRPLRSSPQRNKGLSPFALAERAAGAKDLSLHKTSSDEGHEIFILMRVYQIERWRTKDLTTKKSWSKVRARPWGGPPLETGYLPGHWVGS